MGNSSNDKVHKILENSYEKIDSSEKIESYELNDGIIDENIEKKNYNEPSENLKEERKNIDSPLLDVKDVNKFPYNTIGLISSKFSSSKENYFYTCFAIYKNVVITLASNLIDENKGGKSISISTSFSNEKIKWDNIYIQSKNTNLENGLKSELGSYYF